VSIRFTSLVSGLEDEFMRVRDALQVEQRSAA
jgi:hypothetical protein